MLKNVIILSDGAKISSGAGMGNAIQSCTITECVNSETELTLGSTCSTCLEAKIIAPGGALRITDTFTLSKQNEAGILIPVGVFNPEKPVKSSANVYKVTAYDNISKLDKDLSAWLKGLTGWPYTLVTFAGMVCGACGLKLATGNVPNGSFPVKRFYKPGVTGRQLMRWIGEICCRFCRANAAGDIELAWYQPSEATIQATGERYYFAKSLSYEDYNVAPVDAVQLRLADSDSGVLWPEANAANPYIISGNPILLAQVNGGLLSYLNVIQKELASMTSYRPCKISLPACMDIRAGDTVRIVDGNGESFTTCVMTKTQSGQRDTLECTGSKSRSSSTACHSQSAVQAAQQAVDRQSQQDIFNRLTNGGKVQGLMLGEDGNVYLNVTYATAGVLRSIDGKSWFDLNTGVFHCEGENSSVEVNGGKIELFNKNGTKLIELIPHETAGGQLQIYDQNGLITFGVFAYNQTPYLTCVNLDNGRAMSAKVGFRKLSDGNTVLAIGSAT